MTFRTRFAPSPTGFLHAGNARTAIFCHLAAAAAGGEMLLRIEDSDNARNTPGGDIAICEDLAALGLQWRMVPPQSARARSYQNQMAKLQNTGAAYPCFCSPDALAAERKANLAAGIAPRYSGKCAKLTAEEARAKMAKGEQPAWRFRMPRGRIMARDIVRGELCFDGGDIGDFVICRANGDFAFIFANAADDAADGITCVLRGEDHLPNMPRQMALLSALECMPPQYGHLPLMTGIDGKPLSKRGGAPSVRQLREEGYLPAAMTNYLARIGHKYAGDGMLTMAQLAEGFALSKLSKAAAKFDLCQLQSRQREALRALSAAERLQWMAHLVPPNVDGGRFAAAIADNVLLFAEVRKWAGMLATTTAAADYCAADAAQVIREAGAGFYRAAHNALSQGGDWRRFCAAAAAQTGMSGRRLYLPLRAALTGQTSGPEMAAFFALLTNDEQKRRLRYYF